MTSALLSSPAPYCSSQRRAATLLSFSNSAYQRYHLSDSAPRLGALSFSPWIGLKHLAVSFQRNYTHSERKSKSRRMAVYASLFGVGAPEALVIGVVALLVFGPKGLAEVARNLGKTLRSFQPTIRELQDVSREFKSTFEREIGLDELTSTAKNSYRSNTIVNENQETSSDPNGRPTAELSKELMKITEAQMDATIKSQAELPKEQLQDAPTSEPAASIPAPSGETASDILEATVQIPSPSPSPSPERTQNEGSK